MEKIRAQMKMTVTRTEFFSLNLCKVQAFWSSPCGFKRRMVRQLWLNLSKLARFSSSYRKQNHRTIVKLQPKISDFTEKKLRKKRIFNRISPVQWNTLRITKIWKKSFVFPKNKHIKFRTLNKLFWQGCQNCIHHASKNTLWFHFLGIVIVFLDLRRKFFVRDCQNCRIVKTSFSESGGRFWV